MASKGFFCTARKQQQTEKNQFFEDSEGLLYGPGIAD